LLNLNHLEVFFARTALRATPTDWNIFPSGSG